MGFFDNLSDKLSAGGAKVAEKAKEGYEIASLTATVEKEKVAQEKLYLEIGKKLFNEAKEVLAEKAPEEVAKLEESIKKVEEAKEAIKNIKGDVICPGCGKKVDKNTKFCPACGAVIPEVEAAAEEVAEEVSEETAEETTEEHSEF